MDILNTAPAVTNEEAATIHLPLSDPMDVLVKMMSPSSAFDESKVGRGAGLPQPRQLPPHSWRSDSDKRTPGVWLV